LIFPPRTRDPINLGHAAGDIVDRSLDEPYIVSIALCVAAENASIIPPPAHSLRIKHDEAFAFGNRSEVGEGRHLLGGTGATVEHDYQRSRLPRICARNVHQIAALGAAKLDLTAQRLAPPSEGSCRK
jgi:hypothetical protein